MPIQMCPINIPDNHEFARYGKCKGGANEPFLDHNGELCVWVMPKDSTSDYVILRRIPPEPKYIPFTASTFRPHRDRWVRRKDNHQLEFRCERISLSMDEFMFYCIWYSAEESFKVFEFINADKTTEPFGQKVEG